MQIDDKTTVTVIMSSYNGERYIKEQIESILAQELCSVKLFVRDDGSRDRTISILESYRAKGKLQYYVGNNIKPAKSFLDALINSGESDFYAFADQDDIWESNKLEKAIELLNKCDKYKPNLYFSNLSPANADGIPFGNMLFDGPVRMQFKEIIVDSPNIFGCTMVFNKTLKDIVCKYGVPHYVLMHDIWVALIAALLGNIVYDSNSYIRYRQHGDNHTGASVGFTKKMHNRINRLLGKNHFYVSCQAVELLAFCEKFELPLETELKKYIETIAYYNRNIGNRISYIKQIHEANMPFTKQTFNVLLMLLNRI